MLGRSFLTAALVATATATCYDDTSWFASDLETCDDYAVQAYCNAAGNTGPGWDPIWGPIVEYADANGKSALEACCACGGGVNRECRDSLADWKDTGGDSCTEYTTGYYCTVNGMEGIGWNASWGTLDDNTDRNGVTAKDACCTCGGGVTTWAPTPAPPPTVLGDTPPPSASTSTSSSTSSSSSSTSSSSTSTTTTTTASTSTSTSTSTTTSTGEGEDTRSSAGAVAEEVDDTLMYGMIFGGIAIVLLGVGVGAAVYLKGQNKSGDAAMKGLASQPSSESAPSEGGSIWRHF